MQVKTAAPSFSIAIQAAFWMVALGFMTYLSFITYGWPSAAPRVMFIFSCHLVNFYLFYSWIIPRYYQQKQYPKAIAALVGVLLLLTPIRYMIEQYFLATPGTLRARVTASRGLLVFVVFSEIGIAGFASLLRLAVSDARNKERLAEVEKMHLQTELRFLKAQMSPHFLFNTINNIYSLTVLKSDKAPEALMKLSHLLRYLLYECHTQVPLGKELEALRAFTELFNLRYDATLNFSFTTTVVNEHALVEPLLFIPLLENAVKHSALGILPGAFVNLHISQYDQRLSVQVQNSRTNTPVITEAGGIGLQNIKRRLEVIYPQQYGLKITETATLFLVELSIPLA